MAWNPSLADGPVAVPVYGEPDPETGLAEVTGFEAGYHLNLPEAAMTQALEPFRVTPATPERVFFGEPTAFLKFDDEAAALACTALDALRLNGES